MGIQRTRQSPIAYRALILVLGLTVSGETRQAPCGEPHDAGIDKMVVTEGFKPYLEKAPQLLQGGSRIFVDAKDWVAIGVGLAPLENARGNRIPIGKAKTVARASANKELAGAIAGVKMSGEDSSSVGSSAAAGSDRVRERFLSVSRQDVEASLLHAEVTGTWFADDKRFVAVMVAVGNPGNRLFQASPTTAPSGAHFRKVVMDPAWRDVFRSRAGILAGGASLYRQGGAILILAVGKARMTGDPVDEKQKERASQLTANKEVVQFVSGLQVAARDEATLSKVSLTEEEKTIFDSTKESFRAIRIEKVRGIARMLESVGSWESMDGDYYYQAFVVRLADLL